MPVKQSDFEILLSKYSDRASAIALLKEYRPYLEKLPKLIEITTISLKVCQLG